METSARDVPPGQRDSAVAGLGEPGAGAAGKYK